MIAIKKNIKSIAVIGDGSWPTALIKILMENNVKIKWWVRRREDVQFIKNFWRNPTYLTGVNIDKRYVKPYFNIKRTLRNVDYVLLAVPAAYLKDVLAKFPKDAFKGKKVITSIKGMIPDEDCLVSEYLTNHFQVLEKDISIISGPCHAEEVALGRQSYLTLGTLDAVEFSDVRDLFEGTFTKVSILSDVVGIEYAAVMKNIYALACGISHGLNFGDNFQAVLVSNALQEITKLVNHLHPKERDLYKSPYLGDLLVTTYSQFSRNRTLGTMIGRGYTVKSALMEMKMVAEGYYAVKSLKTVIERAGLELPICDAVYHVMYDGVSPNVEYQILKAKLT